MGGSKHYTLIVISDESPRTHKLRIPMWLVPRALVGLGVVVIGLLLASIHYFNIVGGVTENEYLREENAQLRADLKKIRERIAQIGTTLDRVERLDQKLRTASLLSDPDGTAGVADAEDRDGLSAQATPGGSDDQRVKGERLDGLSAEAVRQEAILRELQRYFEDQHSLLASAPSLWPSRGWVTSDFGHRLDPFTAERKGHQGLDIATKTGSPVTATADGTVVYAGVESGYGKVVVLDHGHGIKTRYGHLSEIGVSVGQQVRRGDQLGGVGSTGRSTGPHLHYEVRVNGIAENPRKFILE